MNQPGTDGRPVVRVFAPPDPDAVYESARAHFSGDELVHLTLAVVAINGWNRLMIAFRVEPGCYRRPAARAA